MLASGGARSAFGWSIACKLPAKPAGGGDNGDMGEKESYHAPVFFIASKSEHF